MQKTPDRVRGYSSFSARWRVSESKLRSVLPPSHVPELDRAGGLARTMEKPEPTWPELNAAFECEMEQRMALGKLQLSTADRYLQTLREFTMFLSA